MKSSVVQGYVARAREWGLLEPRLHGGRYRLTEFGSERLDKVAERSLTPAREEGPIS